MTTMYKTFEQMTILFTQILENDKTLFNACQVSWQLSFCKEPGHMHSYRLNGHDVPGFVVYTDCQFSKTCTLKIFKVCVSDP